ncbi:MAG: MFS transporter [Promethearchaeota archaeon]
MTKEIEKLEFKKSYSFIFSFFYLAQGLYNGIQQIVIPFWLITMMTIDLAVILGIFSITTIPWVIKFLIGLINDKYGSKKFGRRKPWILSFGTLGGVAFIIMGIGIAFQSTGSIINYILICALFWNIGIAFADTSIDGLMLDVTPKENLGKVQSYTWAMNMFGTGAGGIILGAIFLYFQAIPLLFVFEGFFLILSCILPFYIKEKPITKDVQAWSNLKKILSKRSNWKIFTFTFIDAIPYGCVSIMYTIFVLLYAPNPLIIGDVTSLSLGGQAFDTFVVYSILGAISGIGIIIGSIITGRISDNNRRTAVYLANIIYIPLLTICFLFRGPYIYGILMLIFLGIGQGALTASYQSIRGDLSKKYPDLDSTYFALVVSCLNLGYTVGLAMISSLLSLFSSIFTEFYETLFWIMLILAGFQILSFLIFMTINRNEYEFKQKLNK